MLVGAKEIVAPGYGVAEGLLAYGQVLRAAGQQLQSALQAREHCLRREQLAARGGKLYRQGQPVQPDAYLGYGWGVLVGDGEIGLDCHRPGDEESHAVVLSQALQSGQFLDIGQRQRVQWKPVLTLQMEGFAAGYQQLQVLRGVYEFKKLRRCGDHLLEAVNYEQHLLIAQRVSEGLQGRRAGVPTTHLRKR